MMKDGVPLQSIPLPVVGPYSIYFVNTASTLLNPAASDSHVISIFWNLQATPAKATPTKHMHTPTCHVSCTTIIVLLIDMTSSTTMFRR